MKIRKLLKLNQKGFSHVEMGAAVLVIAVVAVVGVYVGTHSKDHAATGGYKNLGKVVKGGDTFKLFGCIENPSLTFSGTDDVDGYTNLSPASNTVPPYNIAVHSSGKTSTGDEWVGPNGTYSFEYVSLSFKTPSTLGSRTAVYEILNSKGVSVGSKTVALSSLPNCN